MFTGFYKPLAAKPGKYVKVEADDDDDIKIRFSLGGDRGLNILSGSPYSVRVNCADHRRIKLNKTTRRSRTESFGPLKYEKSQNRYSIEWNILESWEDTCRMLHVGLSDGTDHTVVVKFEDD